jgi:hypothetical protein
VTAGAEAERLYREVRDEFAARGIGFDAALVTLDLAMAYAKEERTAEMQALALEMIPIFEAQDIHREALAALAVFKQAAIHEQASVAFVKRVVHYLEAARGNPALKFEYP